MRIRLIVVYVLVHSVFAQYAEYEGTEDERLERIKKEFEFITYNIMDSYDEITNNYKEVLLNGASYEQKIDAEIRYSNYLRNQSGLVENIMDDLPYELSRFATLLKKLNNAAMETEDLKKLLQFANNMEENSKNNVIEDSKGNILDKQNFLDFLATSRNASYLSEIWNSWNNNSAYDVNYRDSLSLVKKAAAGNDDYDSKGFWEDMTQYENGYQVAQNIWSEIEPFYKKLHKFTLDRINNFYDKNYTNIPVYLTGSYFGNDWSNIADIILTHQQIYHDAKVSITEKTKKDIYKHCNKVSQELRLKENPKKFWKNSRFDINECDSKVLSFCSEGYSIALTCSNSTWLEYLQAQETSFKVGLKNLDYTNLPIRELRYSFIEEAIESLGSIVAIHDLAFHGLIEKDAYNENVDNQNTARLLLALHVLPRLAYYLSVDTWRLNELEYPTENIEKSWWETRLKYQGVEGNTNEELDFFEDEYVVYNKPYLAKFFGLLVQFDFVQQLTVFSSDQSMPEKLKDNGFQSLINDIISKDPKELLNYHYSTDDVTSVALLQYFSPLEEYFQTAPLDPIPFEKRNLRKMTTTTTTTPIADTTVPTVAQEIPKQNFKLSTDRMLIEESTSEKPRKGEKEAGLSVGMYVLITIGACGCIIVALLVFKKIVKMKRPRPVNRRFEA